MRTRFPNAEADRAALDDGRLDALAFGDVDGDGRADLCARDADAISCARSERAFADASARPEARFAPLAGIVVPSAGDELHLADVDGDGRADTCTRRGDEEIVCALTSRAELRATAGLKGTGAVRFADVDSDGRADACSAGPRGVVCARSHEHAFEHARLWLAADSVWSASFALGDVDGDGRADACGRSAAGLACANSSGASFGHLRAWGRVDGAGEASGAVELGDLNGDGRADACFVRAGAVACAFSTGHAFTAPTNWAEASSLPELAAGAMPSLADVNGDGRADLCLTARSGVRCGMAP